MASKAFLRARSEFYNKSEVDTLLVGYSPKTHTHNYADSNHTHDYAPIVHTHSYDADEFYNGYKSSLDENDLTEQIVTGKYVFFFDDGPQVTMELFNLNNEAQSNEVLHLDKLYSVRWNGAGNAGTFSGVRRTAGTTTVATAAIVVMARIVTS